MDSSFTFSFLRVLPEPNLQESEESRGSHHLFSLMNHYGLVWFAEFPYLCRRLAALGNLKASFHCARLHNLCPLKVNDLLFRQKSSSSYI